MHLLEASLMDTVHKSGNQNENEKKHPIYEDIVYCKRRNPIVSDWGNPKKNEWGREMKQENKRWNELHEWPGIRWRITHDEHRNQTDENFDSTKREERERVRQISL